MSDEVDDFKPVLEAALAFNRAHPDYYDIEKLTFRDEVRKYANAHPNCADIAQALWLGSTTQKARTEGTKASADARTRDRKDNALKIAERCIMFRRTGRYPEKPDMQLAWQAADDLGIRRSLPDKDGRFDISAKHAWDLAKEGLRMGANPSRMIEAAKRRTVHSPKSIFDGSKELK